MSTPQDETPIPIIDEEESSLSTATSLTSLITSHTPHTTGVDTIDAAVPSETHHENQNNPTPQQRARSMSVPNSVFLSPNGGIGGVVRSGSATRSNPRTRTPMRHASPLLVTGRLFSEEEVENNNRGRGEEERLRESIPEEADVEQANEPAIRPGHLLHNHILRPVSTSTTTQQQQTRTQRRSNKQLPSHRKIRRWNNDRFIGTHSGVNGAVHPAVIKEGEAEWHSEYWMPNYPREYRSEFARLVSDDTKRGQQVRDRFLKGEVGTKVNTIRPSSSIPKQFQGISKTTDIGSQMYSKLSPRIRSILSRCCNAHHSTPIEHDNSENRNSLAIQAISAFESYITSCVFQSKKYTVPSNGFPPLQSDKVYQIFETILCGPPDLVIRKKKHSGGSMNIPSIHFYFSEDGTKEEKGNGAFYRILLYAVCNFHGLIASSFSLDGKKKLKRIGPNQTKGVKVVTVQGGAVLGLDLKLLDFVV